MVGGIETGTATLAEANLTSSHGQDRVAIWPRQRENGIVLVCEDVEVVGRGPVGVGVLDHVGFQALSQTSVVGTDTRRSRRPVSSHHLGDGRERRGVLGGFGLAIKDLVLNRSGLLLQAGGVL